MNDVGSNFDESLRRAQATQTAAAREAASEGERMLRLGANIYEELRSAGETAYHVLAQAGAEQFVLEDAILPGRLAVLLLPATYSDSRIPLGRGIYVLDSGHPITADCYGSQRSRWSGKIKDRRRHGYIVLGRPSAAEVRVQRDRRTAGIWTYRPETLRPGDELFITHTIEAEQTEVSYLYRSPFTSLESVTDFVAGRTAELLATYRA